MGPPPTTSSRMSEDEEIELIDTPSTQGPRRPRAARSRSRYDSEPDEDERYGSESDIEFVSIFLELAVYYCTNFCSQPSKISDLPRGPIEGIETDEGGHSNNRREQVTVFLISWTSY